MKTVVRPGLAMISMVLAACAARAGGYGPAPDDAATVSDVTVAMDQPASDATSHDAVAPQDALVPPDLGDPPAARTFDYAITQYVVDQGVSASGAPNGSAPSPGSHTQGVSGFNLDGLFSTTTDAMIRGGEACGHADFFSTTDPDQNMGSCVRGQARGGGACSGGVDNQLPEIAATVQGFGTDLRATLNDGPAMGRSIMIIRVADVNGTPGPTLNDDSVNVSVYTIVRPAFASCSMVSAPGATYAVDNASLTAPGDLGSARIRFSASIVNGRLVTPRPTGAAANFSFGLPIMGMALPLPLYGSQLRVDLTPDRGVNGNLGGYTRLSDLSSMLAALLPAGIPPSTVQTVLQSLVDVQVPSGTATGCTAPNGGISMGFGFTAVRAVVSPATVSGPTPGTCGAP